MEPRAAVSFGKPASRGEHGVKSISALNLSEPIHIVEFKIMNFPNIELRVLSSVAATDTLSCFIMMALQGRVRAHHNSLRIKKRLIEQWILLSLRLIRV